MEPPLIPDPKTFIYKTINGISIAIDVYVGEPASLAQRPIMLFIHGGGYTGGNRTDYSRPLIHEFLTRGYIVTSMDYRLLPETPFVGGQLDDIRDVEPWLRDVLPVELKREKFEIDVKNIVVTGASAGAHLALMTPKLWKAPPVALLAMYGPTDMNNLRYLRRGLLQHLTIPPFTPELGKLAVLDVPPTEIPVPKSAAEMTRPRGLLGLSIFREEVIAEFLLKGFVDGGLPVKGCVPKEEIDEISPLILCSKTPWPPTYQVMGTEDEAFDIHHILSFAAEMKKHGVPCEAIVIPNTGHAFDMTAEVGGEVHENVTLPAVDWLVQFVRQPWSSGRSSI